MVTVKEIQVMRASSGKEEWQEGLVGLPTEKGKKVKTRAMAFNVSVSREERWWYGYKPWVGFSDQLQG